MRRTWRDKARVVIFQIVTDKNNSGKSKKELRKILSKSYPFGEKEHYPYKVWLEEVAFILGDGKQKKKPIEQKISEDGLVFQIGLFSEIPSISVERKSAIEILEKEIEKIVEEDYGVADIS